jgi:hypothetical protein
MTESGGAVDQNGCCARATEMRNAPALFSTGRLDSIGKNVARLEDELGIEARTGHLTSDVLQNGTHHNIVTLALLPVCTKMVP